MVLNAQQRIETRGAEVDSFYHLSGCPVAGQCCQGTACFVARRLDPGRWAKAQAQEQRLYCLGQCFAAPARVGDKARPHVEVRSSRSVLLERVVRGGARSLADYTAQGGGRALEKALAQAPESVLADVEASGLRGRGGAGFPAGRKWRAVWEAQRERVASSKGSLACAPGRGLGAVIVANADEGDPGAYVDRYLMEEDPFGLIEGMIFAAWALGATEGWIYLRAEYPDAAGVLEQALREARAAGWLGERILGRDFAFDIRIHVGRGSYVCGEETALIRSLEGRRPEVQARPPMPARRGLWGRPTLIQNVETLMTIPWIVAEGGAAYGALGFSSSRGTKLVSLNSLFRRPGLYEVEFGIPLRHLVEELGGGLRSGTLQGLIVGGPLAGVIPPSLLDTPFGFEELHGIGASVGHGGVIAYDEYTSPAELLHHVFSFGAYESCGKCTPCRVGSSKIERLFSRILGEGAADYGDERDCRRLVTVLRTASLCGHGIGLGEFADSMLRHYEKELTPCFR